VYGKTEQALAPNFDDADTRTVPLKWHGVKCDFAHWGRIAPGAQATVSRPGQNAR
jgi:hypothetical protein